MNLTRLRHIVGATAVAATMGAPAFAHLDGVPHAHPHAFVASPVEYLAGVCLVAAVTIGLFRLPRLLAAARRRHNHSFD